MAASLTSPGVATYPIPSALPLAARWVLWLCIYQGTATTLTLALFAQPGGGALAAAVNALWLGTYALAGLSLFYHFGGSWLIWLMRYRLWLALITLGTLLSASWSVDPTLTLERSVHFTGSVLCAICIGLLLPLDAILRSLALALLVMMVCSILAALTVPELGLQEYEGRIAWSGVMPSKNTLGFWAGIGILLTLSLALQPQTRPYRLLMLLGSGLCVLCLAMSISATSVLASLTGLLVMVYFHVTGQLTLNRAASLALALAMAAIAGLLFLQIDTAEVIGRSGDLTGRTQIWQQSWALILQRPLTGLGYGTLWFPTDQSVAIQQQWFDLTWVAYHAHNGLLHIATELGIPITLLTLLLVIQQLIESVYGQQQRHIRGALMVLGFTVAYLVSNYSEARMLINRDLTWILFLALPISLMQHVTLVAAATPDSDSAALSDLDRRLARRAMKSRLSGRLLGHEPGHDSGGSGQANARGHSAPGGATSNTKREDHS